MKKYTNIFRLSFVTYLGLWDSWDSFNISLPICIICAALIYQLLYIIHFRKKEHEKFGRSIARAILYMFIAFSILILVRYTDNFINGYTTSDVLGNEKGGPYYGLEAWKNDRTGMFVFMPILGIFTIYEAIYYAITHRKDSTF